MPTWKSSLAALAVVAAMLAAGSALAEGPARVTISVVATTDVHGRAASLPWLGGHLANLRARRAADGGGVVLVDAGDMFQGTLESNLGEGAVMVRGYRALGYSAVAIGNHEFDFGPAGPAHIPASRRDDPRGALKARAAEASYPFLAANLFERGARAPVAWRNVRPFKVLDVAGVRVGIVGVTTKATPFATHPRNFTGLEARPLAPSIVRSAADARRSGAKIVIVAAHAGGDCKRSDNPDDLGSCDGSEEIFALARELPPGTVDLIAAGHTHQMVAHRVAGIPIVQALSDGRAFARVDLEIERATGRIVRADIAPPRMLCGGGRVTSLAVDACNPGDYEGRPVRFDEQVAAAVRPAVAHADAQRAAPLGVVLKAPLRRDLRAESALGNFAADLLRATLPVADLAFINGGSLRRDLPAGPLVYGALYEAFPFDDGVAQVRMRARQLAALVARNLEREAGILSLSGVSVRARCVGPALEVTLYGSDGQRWLPDRPVLAVTNGYLASGGDGLLPGIATGDTPEATPMRERFAELLRARGGSVDPADPSIFDPQAPRLEYPGPRPVRCRQ